MTSASPLVVFNADMHEPSREPRRFVFVAQSLDLSRTQPRGVTGAHARDQHGAAQQWDGPD